MYTYTIHALPLGTAHHRSNYFCNMSDDDERTKEWKYEQTKTNRPYHQPCGRELWLWITRAMTYKRSAKIQVKNIFYLSLLLAWAWNEQNFPHSKLSPKYFFFLFNRLQSDLTSIAQLPKCIWLKYSKSQPMSLSTRMNCAKFRLALVVHHQVQTHRGSSGYSIQTKWEHLSGEHTTHTVHIDTHMRAFTLRQCCDGINATMRSSLIYFFHFTRSHQISTQAVKSCEAVRN